MACTRCKKKKRRNTKISGTMAKKMNMMGGIKDGAMVTAGFVATNLLSNKVGFIAANPMIGALAPIAIGLFLKGNKKGGCSFATGLIASGVVNSVKHFAPAIASQVGLSGFISRSNYTPGVAGGGGSFRVD